MRTADGRILVDLGDRYQSQLTGSVDIMSTSSIDENLTSYSLLPERINAVPYISSSIYNTSTPQIKPIQFNDPDKFNMFLDAQGVIKVAVGSSFTLKLKAMQPPIYNVENGVPVEYVDQTLLAYQWQKNGEDYFGEQDSTRPNSFVSRSGENFEELVFTNVSPTFTGTYSCIALNDVGSVESEQVNIEVYNPDIEDKFYTNLITNPYGKEGTDGWNSPNMEFITNRLSDTPFEKFSQPWKVDLFGYSVDMFYPKPYQLNTHHIRNSNFVQDIMQDGYYFTRERFKYRVKDGKALITANYDVDLSDVVDYIQGSVYGVKAVRAIFGCYIGNAISRFRTSLLSALVTRRTSKFSMIPSKARLNVINALLAGIPMKNEEVRVTLQEFDNETPLMSMVNGALQPGYVMYDAWTKAQWTPTSENIATGLTNAVNVPDDTYETRLIDAVKKNRLFPSEEVVPTYGQYVQFNKLVIDQLNFRTNKIRISLAYETWADVLNITSKEHVDASDECFELVPWDWIAKPMHWPSKPQEDYVKDPQSNDNYSVDWYNQKVLNIKDKSETFRYATLLGSPRAMTTGYNLVLIPLETNSQAKSDYYTKTILDTTDNKHPKLKVGTTISSDVGVYLGSRSDYDYDVFSIRILNRYNIPFNQTTEYQLAQGGVATKTSVSTYKYNKANPFDFPPLGIYPGGLTNAISPWDNYVLTTDPNFKITPGSNPEFILIYNSGSGDLVDANIEQVAGNLASGIAKYTNNLVTDVPITFVTQSMLKNDFLNQMGFTLNLVGLDYGIATTESVSSMTPSQRKAEYVKDWNTLRMSGSYNHFHRLLHKIDDASQTLVPYNNRDQYIIYDSTFNSKWSQTTTANTPRLLLDVPFQNIFAKEAYFEKPATYTGTSTPGSYWSSYWAQNHVVNAIAVDKALNYGLVVNGQNVSPKYQVGVSSGVTTQPVYGWYGWSYGWHNAGTYSYTYQYAGSTRSRVKLSKVSRQDIKTPAAIVIPSQQKIYYFIYSYSDNSFNEV